MTSFNDFKRTKIVATISDLRCDVEFIKELYEAGMNVVRMNTAHIDETGFMRVVNNVRAVSDKIAILVDTKGPEIRTTSADESINLRIGDKIKVAGDPSKKSSRDAIYVSYLNLVKEMNVGMHILIDDGVVDLLIMDKEDDHLICEVQNDGVVGSRKSVNIPNSRIDLPSLTERDRDNILMGIENKVDFIAHSFVRHEGDVKSVQDVLDAHGSKIKIISKIENQEGVDNIDEILKASYGIMVARGDLGIEVAQEKIPGIQRSLIKKAIAHKKPVIVATQMLHSMIENPRPTRAEITDIANAIFYRTDAVMLSGETAYGKYPVEAVKTMATVAREAERSNLKERDIRVTFESDDHEVTSYLAKQAVKSESRLNTKAIVTDSHSGQTARVLAAFRGKVPVYAMCTSERVARELSLSYGIVPDFLAGNGLLNTKESRRAYYTQALEKLIDMQVIQPEDRVAYLGGSFGEMGGTTYLDINEACNVLQAKEKYNLPDYTI